MMSLKLFMFSFTASRRPYIYPYQPVRTEQEESA